MFQYHEHAEGISQASRTTRTLLKSALIAAAAFIISIGGARIASADDTPLTVPDPCDFATSGGFVVTDAEKKANFGAHGGCKHGEFWGHVNFVDHATGLHVSSIEITGYVQPVDTLGNPIPNARDICGTASTNRGTDTVVFRVRLIDGGEPSTNDFFGLKVLWPNQDVFDVSTRHLSTGKGGGDVQVHEPNESTIPQVEAPAWPQMCNGVYPPGVPQGAPEIGTD
jgi:hypothetical protein